MERFFSRFSFSSARCEEVALSRAAKKALQASEKRFQTASEYFLGTAPMVFHSFCKAMNILVVGFQSVLSLRDSAFSQSSIFFA